MAPEMIGIEVAAGLPERQVVVALQVPSGTTLGEAVTRAEIADRLPGLEIDPNRLGIFGKRRGPETVLEAGDRVEVYRPLTADPKEIRRQLAELDRSEKRRRS